MVNFPASLDNGTTLPTPTGTNTQNSPDHASLHGNENLAIIAAETKIGIGSSAPIANTLLFGTGAGTSAWTALTSAQLAATLSDETGSGSAVFATTPTLVTPKVDTINEATGGNGTTIGGVNIKSGALNTNNSVVTANITASAVTYDKVATGIPVQVVNTTSGAVATGTTVVPWDDTIPQNTEGDQYMSLAITPKSATNILVIAIVASLATSGGAKMICGALFQDSTAGALAADAVYAAAVGATLGFPLTHTMTAATTSATTFKFRAGGETAGTITFNGVASARKFGGIVASSIIITEYKA